MSRLLHALRACRAALVMWRLGRYGRTRPDGDHDGWAARDICLLADSPQSPGIRGGPGAAPSREQEPEPRGHVVALELPEPGVGARAARTHGSPGATLSREAGAVVLI
jgi:hypothetical protein